MPIFEYRCEKCGHRFEKLVSRSDSPVECDNCHGTEITKLFSSFAARVGSGTVSCSTGGCGPSATKCAADSGFG